MIDLNATLTAFFSAYAAIIGTVNLIGLVIINNDIRRLNAQRHSNDPAR